MNKQAKRLSRKGVKYIDHRFSIQFKSKSILEIASKYFKQLRESGWPDNASSTEDTANRIIIYRNWD